MPVDSHSPDGQAAPPRPAGTIRVGSVAGVEVLVRSSWLILAVLIALVMAPMVDSVRPGLGALKYLAGLAFAVLLYLSVLLHEISHALMAKRFGLGVTSIQLDFLGGVTQIANPARTAFQEFAIAVVGPVTSLAVGLISLVTASLAPPGLLLLALQGLAGANLIVGMLNLVPGLPLDGGRVLKSIVWALSRNQILGTTVAAWVGRVAGICALLAPAVAFGLGVHLRILDIFMSAVVGMFMWTGASATLRSIRVRGRLPGLVARELARRSIAVAPGVSVAQAITQARDQEAGAIVVRNSDGTWHGIVSEEAVAAMPAERQAVVPVVTLAGTLQEGMAISADLAGEDLIKAVSQTPANDYLLLESDGSCFGVLSLVDLDRAFSNMMKGKA